MRKITTILIFLLATLATYAQLVDDQQGIPLDDNNSAIKAVKAYRSARNNTKTVKSRWYNYGDAVIDMTGYTSKVWSNYLFPDTFMYASWSNGYFMTTMHSIGDVVNPKSDYFYDDTETNLNINKYMPYTIDSISVYAWYDRMTASSIVDTLIVQVQSPVTSVRYFTGMQASFGVDTLKFGSIDKDVLSHLTTKPNYVTIKVPLTVAVSNDTLDNGLCVVRVPVNINVPAGGIFSTTVAFQPGYSYANFDTLNKFNSFRYLSYEEKGEGTLPDYVVNDYNMSYYCTNQLKYYTTTTGSYYTLLLPTYAWAATFRYEHNWIDYLLTSNVTGMEEVSQQNSIAYPNPVSKGNDLSISVTEKSDIIITDLVGKVINRISADKILDGKAVVNTSNMTSGVYFYTVNKVTKKFVVVE